MTNDIMSSEKSAVDEEGRDITVIHPLPWRSKYCSNIFSMINKYVDKHRSTQGRRQLKRREHGSPSTRIIPPGNTLPMWVVEETTD